MFKKISKKILFSVFCIGAFSCHVQAMRRLERLMAHVVITVPSTVLQDTYKLGDEKNTNVELKQQKTPRSVMKKDQGALYALRKPIAPERDFSDPVFTKHHMHILTRLLGKYSIASDGPLVSRTKDEICSEPDQKLEEQFIAIITYQITRTKKLREEICIFAGAILRDRMSNNPLSLDLLTLLATNAPEYKEVVKRVAQAYVKKGAQQYFFTLLKCVNYSIEAAIQTRTINHKSGNVLKEFNEYKTMLYSPL